MTIDIKPILNAGVAAQSVALLGYNAKLALKKKKSSGDLLKAGVGNIVGISLLTEQSRFIGSL